MRGDEVLVGNLKSGQRVPGTPTSKSLPCLACDFAGSARSQARGTQRHIWTQTCFPRNPLQGLGPSALLPLFPLNFFFPPRSPTRAPRVSFPPGTKAGTAAPSSSKGPQNAGVAPGAQALRWVRTEPDGESTPLRDGFKAQGCSGDTWQHRLPAPELWRGVGSSVRKATSLPLPLARTHLCGSYC